jgi:hypothetical protein
MPDMQDRQAAQALLRGMNTMQMQAGLMPGGVPLQSAPMMQMPVAPHPAQFSSGLLVQFQQQQQVAQLTLPPMQFGGMTPVSRPMGLMHGPMPPVALPGAQFGFGHGMARQQAIMGTNRHMAEMQAGMGLGFRGMGLLGSAGIGAMGGALLGAPMGPAGMLMGGIAGATAFEHFGGGQAFQNAGNQLMTPLIQARQRQLELQQMSMGFVRNGADLSPTGMGLSATSSMRLGQGLMGMADSRGFQQDTGGMFNRQDVMKITRMASQFGMLDQSRTADEIRQSVGKISRALSNFMKLAEEPDVQEAMRMMANMRSLGMNLGETSTAVRNARQFARMAGTDMRGIMQAGMQGAGMFQAAGLSGAAGMNAGMAATGMAGQMAGLMSPARLAMAGGREGVASTLMGGAAQAGTLDSLLPMMLMRRNGQLAIDQSAIMDLAQGRLSIQDAMRQGASRIQQLGGRETLMELSTRRRELQDEAQRAMGGQLATLMPLIQARAIAAGTPGMTMGGALRTLGMSEQGARTYEQMVQDPRFWANMRQQSQQQMLEDRRSTSERMRRLEEEAAMPLAVRSALSPVRRISRRAETTFDEFMERQFGFGQDADEQVALTGGRLIRASRSDYESDALSAHRRDLGRAGQLSAGGADRAAQVRALVGQEEARSQRLDSMRASYVTAPFSPFNAGFAGGTALLNHFSGPSGFGLTAAARGGEFMRDTVMAQESIQTRIMHGTGLAQYMGQGRSSQDVERRAREMDRMGSLIDTTATQSARERTRIQRTARRAAGATMTEERFDQVSAAAASAINRYLESRVTSGVIGTFTTADVSEEEMRQQVRQAALDAGATQEEAERLARDQDFLRNAVHLGEGSRTPQAQAAAERHVEAGGATRAAGAQRDVAAMRQLADQHRERALSIVGGERSRAGSTRAERTRMLELLSGSEDQQGTRARREALAIRALRERARTTGDQGAERQAALLEQRFRRRYSADLQEQASQSAQTAEVDSDVLASMGQTLAGSKDIERTLQRATEEANEALRFDQDRATTETLGQQGSEVFRTRGVEGLRQFLEEGGELRGLSRSQVDDIRGGRMSQRQLERLLSQRGQEGPSLLSGEGLGRLAQDVAQGDFNSVVDSLQSFATRGGQAPTDEARRTPQNFEEAVVTFSEASERLLQAAEAMDSGGALSSINGVMATAATGMSPLPGLLGVLPNLIGAFGGGGGR